MDALKLNYLSDVLGVEQIVLPAEYSPAKNLNEVSGSETSDLSNDQKNNQLIATAPDSKLIKNTTLEFMVITESINEAELILLKKMLASVNIVKFNLCVVKSTKDLKSLSLQAQNRYLIFNSQYVNYFKSYKGYLFTSLSQLNNSTNLEKQKRLKLAAWETLKKVAGSVSNVNPS